VVFDGQKHSPYVESDEPRPTSPLGLALRRIERVVLESGVSALVVRTGPVFGWPGEGNPVSRALAQVRSDSRVSPRVDEVVSPTFASDCVNVALDLLIDGERGIFHLANPGAVTMAALLDAMARRTGIAAGQVESLPRSPGPALDGLRMRALLSERVDLLPPLFVALERYLGAASRLVGATAA
jgi:dTDP-4-dehydrorhamnose reductase